MKLTMSLLIPFLMLFTACSQTPVKSSYSQAPQDVWNLELTHQLNTVIIGLVEEQCGLYLSNTNSKNSNLEQLNDFRVYAKSRYDNEVNYVVNSTSGIHLVDLKLEKQQQGSTASCKYSVTVSNNQSEVLSETIHDLYQWQKNSGYLSISQFLQKQKAVAFVEPIRQPVVMHYEQSPGDIILTGILDGFVQIAVEEILCGIITGGSCHHHGYTSSTIVSVNSPKVSHSTFR